VFAWPARAPEGSGVTRWSTARAAAATALAVLVPVAAIAGEPRRHDGGFFFRVAPGGGYTRTAITERGDRFALKGTSGSIDFAIGAVVKKNLAVHVTLGAWGLIDPKAESNGMEEVASNASMTMVLIGGGFTYYLGPSNVYLTASGGAAKLRLELEGESNESNTGIAFDAGVGKEWWVSDRWGIGVSGTAGYHSVPPGDAAGKFKGPSFALRVSITFN
jgi:hypothetical protein